MESTQTCNSCKKDKPLSEFYPSSKTRCRTCWKLHFKALKDKKAKLGETLKGKDVKSV